MTPPCSWGWSVLNAVDTVINLLVHLIQKKGLEKVFVFVIAQLWRRSTTTTTLGAAWVTEMNVDDDDDHHHFQQQPTSIAQGRSG